MKCRALISAIKTLWRRRSLTREMTRELGSMKWQLLLGWEELERISESARFYIVSKEAQQRIFGRETHEGE